MKINGISGVKPIPKEPELKIFPPKTPRSKEEKFKNGLKNNRPAKKSPKMLMLESRQRIMSTKLLTKTRKRTGGKSL